jgi:hypothetical protein
MRCFRAEGGLGRASNARALTPTPIDGVVVSIGESQLTAPRPLFARETSGAHSSASDGSLRIGCYTRRMTPRYFLLICVISTAANAQIAVHFGAEAGVPITDTLSSTSIASALPGIIFSDRYNSETKRLLVGPTFRAEFPHGLGIEFDALYQRINYDHAISNSQPTAQFFSRSFEQTTANRWQFPLLVQYSRDLSKAKVFAKVGPSISKIANSRSTINSTSSSGPSSTTSSISTTTGQGGTLAGITVGAGIDLPLFHLRLRPEFRYSHWFSPSATPPVGVLVYSAWYATSAPIYPTFRTNANEADVLLGLTF